MPDSLGFEHLPHRGTIYHRCVECDEFPFGTRLTEKERERHHRKHENVRKHALEQQRKANLRLAQKAKREYAKEVT